MLPPQTETPVPKAVGPPGATEWATIRNLSTDLAGSNLVPSALRGKPADVALIILTGREVGLPPIMALSHIHVIDAKPTLSAETMRALVIRAGHRFDIVDSSSERCVVEVARAERPGHSARFTWTLEDAKRAELLNKGNWKKYPQAQLLARATSAACRAFFPDVLMGASYTPEELEQPEAAVQPLAGEVVQPAAEQPRELRAEDVDPDDLHTAVYGARSRAELVTVLADRGLCDAARGSAGVHRAVLERVQVADAGGELVSGWELVKAVGATLPASTPDAPEPATREQLTAVNTVASSWGLTERDERLAWLSEWTADGRALASSSELTKAEAHRLLEEHAQRRQQPVPDDDVQDAEVVEDETGQREPDGGAERREEPPRPDPARRHPAVAQAMGPVRSAAQRAAEAAEAERMARLDQQTPTPTTEEQHA